MIRLTWGFYNQNHQSHCKVQGLRWNQQCPVDCNARGSRRRPLTTWLLTCDSGPQWEPLRFEGQGTIRVTSPVAKDTISHSNGTQTSIFFFFSFPKFTFALGFLCSWFMQWIFFGLVACGMLVPQTEVEPVLLALETWSLNYQTARVVPKI